MTETNPYQISGYPFADKESEPLLRLALRAMAAGRRASLFISGPLACGKTRLANEFLSLKFPHPSQSCFPRDEKAMASNLIVALARGYLWLDIFNQGGVFDRRRSQQYSPRAAHSALLEEFLSAEYWSYKKYRSTETVTVKNNCIVVVCGAEDAISDALRLRCYGIDLAGRDDLSLRKDEGV